MNGIPLTKTYLLQRPDERGQSVRQFAIFLILHMKGNIRSCLRHGCSTVITPIPNRKDCRRHLGLSFPRLLLFASNPLVVSLDIPVNQCFREEPPVHQADAPSSLGTAVDQDASLPVIPQVVGGQGSQLGRHQAPMGVQPSPGLFGRIIRLLLIATGILLVLVPHQIAARRQRQQGFRSPKPVAQAVVGFVGLPLHQSFNRTSSRGDPWRQPVGVAVARGDWWVTPSAGELLDVAEPILPGCELGERWR